MKQVHPEKMQNALTMDILATDLADYLVRKGVRRPMSYIVKYPSWTLLDPIPRNAPHIWQSCRSSGVEEVSTQRIDLRGFQELERKIFG